MDFDLNREQKMLQKAVREFIKDKIAPVAAEYDRKGPMSKPDAVKFLKQLEPFGYIGTFVPEKYGGPELSKVDYGIIHLELRKAYASLGGVVGITSTAASVICNAENEMLKEKCLPLMLTGEHIGCLGITEPNVGSDPSSIETTAVLDGDNYIINGTKIWISNGSIADYVVLTAAAESETSGREGICLLLVQKEQSPFEAKEIPKMGLKSFPTSELTFSDCKVPKENLLFPVGQGFDKIQDTLVFARCSASIAGVAIAQAALEASIAHARQREQFGKVIGKFQLVQEMIAEMVIEIDAARLLAFRALLLLDAGKKCRKESSIAKAYACEMVGRVASKAIQIHGAYGLAEEYPLERYFRDARSYTIPDGTTQIQQLIIARETLGLSALK